MPWLTAIFSCVMNYNPCILQNSYMRALQFGKTFYSPQAGASAAGYGNPNENTHRLCFSGFLHASCLAFIEPVLRFHDKTAFDIFVIPTLSDR